MAHFPFPLVGGYAVHPAPDGRHATLARADRLGLLIERITRAHNPRRLAVPLDQALTDLGVDRVLVLPSARGSAVARLLREETGTRSRGVGSCQLLRVGGP